MSTNYTIGGAGSPYKSDGGDGGGGFMSGLDNSNPFLNQQSSNNNNVFGSPNTNSGNNYNPFTSMDASNNNDPFGSSDPFGQLPQAGRHTRSLSTPQAPNVGKLNKQSSFDDKDNDKTAEWLAGFGPSSDGVTNDNNNTSNNNNDIKEPESPFGAFSPRNNQNNNDSNNNNSGNVTTTNPFLDDFFNQDTSTKGGATSKNEIINDEKNDNITKNEKRKNPLQSNRSLRLQKSISAKNILSEQGGYDISIFAKKHRQDKNAFNEYLCGICDRVCRNAVHINCPKKKHLFCEDCIKAHIKDNGNHCPFHTSVKDITYEPSKFVNYHLKTMEVVCPLEKNDGTSCLWQGTLQEYDQHCLSNHNPFVECPYASYGCQVGNKLLKNELKQHLLNSTNYHMTLLLKQVNYLTNELNISRNDIQSLMKQNLIQQNEITKLSHQRRISDDNVWIITGSYKAYKHKYHQIYSVNLATEYRTYLKVLDINNPLTMQPTPFESDEWDVGDFGISFLNGTFDIPLWMLKLYPILNICNRSRYNSIMFRVAGHQIKTTKPIDRCDAILFDKYHTTVQIPSFYINDLPKLNIKRYNCESVYSPTHQTLVVVGGSGMDKKQINSCETWDLSDKYVLKDRLYDEYVCYYNDDTREATADSINDGLETSPSMNNNNNNGGSGYNNTSQSQMKARSSLIGNDSVKNKEMKSGSMRNSVSGTPAANNVYTIESKSSLFNKYKLEWRTHTMKNMIEPKEDMSTILFCDKNNHKREFIFVGGGWHNGVLNTSQVYNWDRNEWVKLANLNVKQNAAGVRYWESEERIMLIGGFNKESYYYAEYFDFKQQKWYDLPKTQYKHRYKPAVWIKNKGDFDNPGTISSLLPSNMKESNQIVCVAGSGVLKSEAGMCEWLDMREGKWNSLKKGMASYFSLGMQINQNNWRSWRLLV